MSSRFRFVAKFVARAAYVMKSLANTGFSALYFSPPKPRVPSSNLGVPAKQKPSERTAFLRVWGNLKSSGTPKRLNGALYGIAVRKRLMAQLAVIAACSLWFS